MSNETRELARAWFEEIWNERRLDTIDRMIDPECIGHHEGQPETKGVEDFKKFRNQLLELVPDLKLQIEDIVADETNAVVRWRFTGTSSVGNRPPLDFSGMSWMKFADGKVVEGWDRWNQGAFQQQLSA